MVPQSDLLVDPKRLRVRWSFSLPFCPPHQASEKHPSVPPARRLVSLETGQTATHRLAFLSHSSLSFRGTRVKVVLLIASRIYLWR